MDVRVVRSSMSKSGKSLADDVEEIVRTIGERVLNEKQTALHTWRPMSCNIQTNWAYLFDKMPIWV